MSPPPCKKYLRYKNNKSIRKSSYCRAESGGSEDCRPCEKHFRKQGGSSGYSHTCRKTPKKCFRKKNRIILDNENNESLLELDRKKILSESILERRQKCINLCGGRDKSCVRKCLDENRNIFGKINF